MVSISLHHFMLDMVVSAFRIVMKVEEFEVEKKSFQVKFEGSNGRTWISTTKRSRGFVVSIGFGKEEVEWLTEHLKKAVELEASRGFMRKIREDGPRNGTRLSVGKWARAVVNAKKSSRLGSRRKSYCENDGPGKIISERKVYSPEEMVAKRKPWLLLENSKGKWGRVTKVARESLNLVDLSKVKLWVEMLPNVMLPALLKSTRSRDKLLKAGGCVSQWSKNAEGLRGSTKDDECYSRRLLPCGYSSPRDRSAVVFNRPQRAGSSTKVAPLFSRSQGPVEVRAGGDEAFSEDDGWALRERPVSSQP
ncbi:hypothetical protein CK203_034944 [Vitis vinifera]|uniref:DUF4283 domain-containing protein n=1 Tax=Vitis vinifera TaxID=29760 RepID=A0A438FYR9_VITVI|nr:hypothetical protein CK203_034944 [Vitis vinifera]